MTEQERRELVGLLKIGHGSLVAIDRALLAEPNRRVRAELAESRVAVAADVDRLYRVLIRG